MVQRAVPQGLAYMASRAANVGRGEGEGRKRKPSSTEATTPVEMRRLPKMAVSGRACGYWRCEVHTEHGNMFRQLSNKV